MTRTVTRRDILGELAVPPRGASKSRLTEQQCMVALAIQHDMQARWGTSRGVCAGCATGGGDGPLRREPVDFAASRRIQEMLRIFHAHERHLFGEIERVSHLPNGRIENIAVRTGYADGDQHRAALIGRIAAMLDTASQIYRSDRAAA